MNLFPQTHGFPKYLQSRGISRNNNSATFGYLLQHVLVYNKYEGKTNLCYHPIKKKKKQNYVSSTIILLVKWNLSQSVFK